jgi:NADPH:quinone reductase-like Zn-dependent oxidoreductase
MKAVRFHEHGGPDVLRYEEAPDPVVAPDGVLVRVRACALNHLDLWQRRGLDRVRIPMPHVSGADIAGEIVAVGEAARAWQPGQRVMLQPGLSCGHCAACLSGEDNRCARYDVIGLQSAGGYAEFIAVPAVLVVAAGSGVGQAAIQIAKWAHARVIATAGSAAKLEKARALGADEGVDHYTEDVAARVKTLTGGRGVDVVIEHVGVATWERSLRCLARGGRLVTCGATTGHAAALDLRHLFARQLSLLGSYMGAKRELQEASELFYRGIFCPVVDRTFPLAEAAAAHRHLESSAQFGKIVLTV